MKAAATTAAMAASTALGKAESRDQCEEKTNTQESHTTPS
jgi:hypothetical protein